MHRRSRGCGRCCDPVGSIESSSPLVPGRRGPWYPRTLVSSRFRPCGRRSRSRTAVVDDDAERALRSVKAATPPALTAKDKGKAITKVGPRAGRYCRRRRHLDESDASNLKRDLARGLPYQAPVPAIQILDGAWKMSRFTEAQLACGQPPFAAARYLVGALPGLSFRAITSVVDAELTNFIVICKRLEDEALCRPLPPARGLGGRRRRPCRPR